MYTIILTWPIRLDRQYDALFFFCDSLCNHFFSFALMPSRALKTAAVTLFVHWTWICAVRPYLPKRYQIVGCGIVSGIRRRLWNRMSCTPPKAQTMIRLARSSLEGLPIQWSSREWMAHIRVQWGLKQQPHIMYILKWVSISSHNLRMQVQKIQETLMY